ncbi:MAG TPA: hypothetical protein PK961_05475 [bacterium]|nr:hypothetical protein [bacterium]
MIHLIPVLLNGLSAFNEDPVSLPPILAFVQVLGWLAIGINIRYLFSVGKLYSFWVLLTGVMLAGSGLTMVLVAPDRTSIIVLAVMSPFMIGGLLVGLLIGPEETSLKLPAKSTIVRDKPDCLIVKFRRHKLIWRGLFFTLILIGFYWTAIIPLVLAPLGTSVPVFTWTLIAFFSGFVFIGPFFYTMMTRKKIAAIQANEVLTIEEKKKKPLTIPFASVQEIAFDREEKGKRFMMRVRLVMQNQDVILIDEGTNGRYLYRLGQRLAEVLAVPFHDLQQ